MRKLLIAGLFGITVVGSGGLFAGGPATHLTDTGSRLDAQIRLAQAVDEDEDNDEDVQPDVGPSPDDQDNQDDQGDPQADDGDDDEAALPPAGINI